MDLIRELLLRFEQDDTSVPEGWKKMEVAYHVKQMVLAGLIEANVIEAPSPGRLKPVDYIIKDITPAGHDFIAALKNNSIWSKVKNEFSKKAVPLTIDLVVFTAKKIAKDHLNLE